MEGIQHRLDCAAALGLLAPMLAYDQNIVDGTDVVSLLRCRHCGRSAWTRRPISHLEPKAESNEH
jgi:hypothetical protein